MADLVGALDAALSARYRVTEVKSPITQRRGLLGRMNQLEKLHSKGATKAQAAARAAASAGISKETWRRWRLGGQPPAAATLRKLEGAYTRQISLPSMKRAIKNKPAPRKVIIWSEVRWTDSDKKKYNATKYRKIEFTQMRPAMLSVIRTWAAAGPVAAAEAFERRIAEMHSVPDDEDGSPGVRFEGERVTITFET